MTAWAPACEESCWEDLGGLLCPSGPTSSTPSLGRCATGSVSSGTTHGLRRPGRMTERFCLPCCLAGTFDEGGRHGVGLLDRPRVPGAPGLDAGVRARGDLAAGGPEARVRPDDARDGAAPGAGQEARSLGGAP